jgi:Transglutaminase-like superfamily
VTRLRGARRLSASERRDAARALACLAAARVALRLTRYAVIQRALAKAPVRSPPARRLTSIECGRAVERAGRVMPRAGCLARAVAAEWLLRRDGHPADLTLGVALDPAHHIAAHAWVESNGLIVIGRDDSVPYERLLPVSGTAAAPGRGGGAATQSIRGVQE